MKKSIHLFLIAITILLAVVAVVGVRGYFWKQSPTPSVKAPQIQNNEEKSRIPPLNSVVEQIVNEGRDIPYLKFNYLIKDIPLTLASHDIDALVGFISGPRPPKFTEAGWGSLVNDIEECLTVQTVPSREVADALVAIFRDESKIQMQRDYALQHIGGFAIFLIHTSALESRETSSVDHSLSPIFPSLLAELKSAASESSQPWSGTALNLLDGVLRAADYRTIQIPGLDSDTLVNLSIFIARDSSAPLNARLPALQAASRHNSPAALELARKILSAPDSGIMLVQSASATLARLGTLEDLPLLQTSSDKSSRHTSIAINEAIASIRSRFKTR